MVSHMLLQIYKEPKMRLIKPIGLTFGGGGVGYFFLNKTGKYYRYGGYKFTHDKKVLDFVWRVCRQFEAKRERKLGK